MKITPEDIRDAMGGISEQLITEAAAGSREIKERNRMKLISTIASVVLVSAVALSTAAALRQPAADSPAETTDEETTSAPEYKVPEETFTVTANIDGHDIQISRTIQAGEIRRVEIAPADGISVNLADTCGQFYDKMILEVEKRSDESYEKFCVECDITTGEVNDFMRKHSYFDIESDDSWQIMLSRGLQPLTWRYDRSGVVMIAAVVPTNGGWSAYELWAYDSASSTLHAAGLFACDPASSFQGSNITVVPKSGGIESPADDGGSYALLWYKSPAAYDPLPGEEMPSPLTVSKEASTFFDGLPLETVYNVTESQTLDGTAKVEFMLGSYHVVHRVTLSTGAVKVDSITNGNEVTKEIKTEYDGKPLMITYTEIDGNIAGISFDPSKGYKFALADKSGSFYNKMLVLITHETDNGVNGRESFAAVLDIRTGELDDFVRDAEVVWPYDGEGMYRTVTWQYNASGTVMIALTDAASERSQWGTVFAMWMYDQRTDTLTRAEMGPYVGENIRFFDETNKEFSFAQYAILWRVQNEAGLVDIVLEANEALDLFPYGNISVPAHDVSIESAVDWKLALRIEDKEYIVDLITGDVTDKHASGTEITTTYIDGEPVEIYWEKLSGGSVLIDSVACHSGKFVITQFCVSGMKMLIETSSGSFAICDLNTGEADEFGREYLDRTPGSDGFESGLVSGMNGRFVYAVYFGNNGDADPRLHAVFRFDLTDGTLLRCECRNEPYLRISGGYSIVYEKTNDGEPFNASGFDTLFSDPGADGYTVSDRESWGRNVARIEYTDGDRIYFIDLHEADGPYSLYERTFHIGDIDVSIVWREYADGRFTMPVKTFPDRPECEVIDISADKYALVRMAGTGECYIVNVDGAVIRDAEKIFSAIGSDPENCTLSLGITEGSMIVTVNDPHETDGCMLPDRIYHVKYYMDSYHITALRENEISALPELAEYFEGHSYGYISAEFEFGVEEYISIEAYFWKTAEDKIADKYSVLILAEYDPETGTVVDLKVLD